MYNSNNFKHLNMAILSYGQVGWRSAAVAQASSSTLNTNLYSVYNAENNANDSFGSNNGTAVGGLTYTTGKIGQAFQFNGTNSYVSLPNSSGQFNFTGNFTINAWINIPNYNVGQAIFVNFSSGGSYGYGIAAYLGTNNTFAFEMRNGNTIGQFITIGGIPTSNWKMVTFVREVGQTSKVYIDGVLSSGSYALGLSSISPGFQASQNVNLGGFNNNSNANHKQDATSIWTRTLTISEVTELYNSGNGKQYPF
jgi:hypothetical protein